MVNLLHFIKKFFSPQSPARLGGGSPSRLLRSGQKSANARFLPIDYAREPPPPHPRPKSVSAATPHVAERADGAHRQSGLIGYITSTASLNCTNHITVLHSFFWYYFYSVTPAPPSRTNLTSTKMILHHSEHSSCLIYVNSHRSQHHEATINDL